MNHEDSSVSETSTGSTTTHLALRDIAVEIVDSECREKLETGSIQLVLLIVDAGGTFRQHSLDLSPQSPGKWLLCSDPPLVPVDPLSIAVYALSADQKEMGELVLVSDTGLRKAVCCATESQGWCRTLEAVSDKPALRISWKSYPAVEGAGSEGEVVLTPDAYFEKQGLSSYARFEKTTDTADIDDAIRLFQRSVYISAPDHPDLHSRFNNLASAHSRRFDCQGRKDDLETAIDLRKRAILLATEDEPMRATWLANLGKDYLNRFCSFGDMKDLDRACSFHKRALDTSPHDHRKRHAFLDTYGLCLRKKFSYTGNMEHLNDAIVFQEKAIELQRSRGIDDPEMFIYANINLGGTYQVRFHTTRNIHDLQAGIAALQYAVILSPIISSIAHSIALANMASALCLRGAHLEATKNTDYEDSVSLARVAISVNPSTSFLPRFHGVLADSLTSLYQKTGEEAHLDEAIDSCAAAIASLPEGSPTLPATLDSLASCLRSRFDRKRDNVDINMAVGLQRKAVELTPDGHPDLPHLLNGMGLSLSRQFEAGANPTDFQLAIKCHERAVQLSPPTSPMLSSWLNNLSSLYLRTPATAGASLQLLYCSLSAVNCSRRAALHPHGRLLGRLQGARTWARLSMSKSVDPKSMYEGYELAISLVATLAGLDLTVRNRHAKLARVIDLALEAASSAIALKNPNRALEWLEKGRCLVWAQLNSLRSPLDAVRRVDEALADRLFSLSKSLDTAGSRPLCSTTPSLIGDAHPMLREVARDVEVNKHLKLAEDWEEALKAVRAISGFENFLRPPQITNLFENLPQAGPVVVVNVHQDRCDALVLMQGLQDAMCVNLPNFSHAKAERLREQLRAYLTSVGARMRGTGEENLNGRGIRKWERVHSTSLSSILRQLWIHVAKPILDALAFNRPCPTFPQTRLWWCVTGPLAFLPLHAAGLYDVKNVVKLSDFVISSYIPTVTSLISSLNVSSLQTAADTPVDSLLLVAQPDVPSLPPIPGVSEEVHLVCSIVKGHGIKTRVLERDSGTIDAVSTGLAEHNCVHLACHATQDTTEPLSSGFFLHDGRLDLSTLLKLDLKSAQLAYLSACHTSAGDEKLSEEAVHLAAGMMALGFRGVVATMWAIQDSMAPKVAHDFYQELLRLWSSDSNDPQPIGHYAPYALHWAIKEMQRKLGSDESALLAWVPYVHFGL